MAAAVGASAAPAPRPAAQTRPSARSRRVVRGAPLPARSPRHRARAPAASERIGAARAPNLPRRDAARRPAPSGHSNRDPDSERARPGISVNGQACAALEHRTSDRPPPPRRVCSV
eukprot:351729-Chlamydomonas_euryale.AAC.4